MAQSPLNRNRLFDGDFSFKEGVQSDLHPSMLSPNSISWGINTVNSDGTIETRPGYRSLAAFGTGKAQGMTLFQPTNGSISMVVAISGKIWVSPYPFDTWTRLNNIQFDPYVDHICFKDAVQTLVNGTIVPTLAVLIMQDGMSQPAFWDGSNNRHLLPGGNTNETVQGLWMEWIGQRLWVARGNEVFASDLYDPLHFTETLYLAEGGSLQPLDGKTVTALARTADQKSLLVFTEDNTTTVAASITDRTQWKTTANFISLLFPGVGCVSGVGYCYLNGELWWFSREGVRRFVQVALELLVSKNNLASNAMVRSFSNLSPCLSRACAFSFRTFTGFSVPSGDILNRHTWVSDTTATDSGKTSDENWNGVWMGTRPVQWSTGVINGKDRCFHLSQDRIGGIHVWEAFNWYDKSDDDGLIFCSTETRGLLFKEPFTFKRFKYTDIHLEKILGEVDFTAEYRGDYGCWKKILDIKLCAQECRQLECTNQNGASDHQSRYLRTQDSKPDCVNNQGPYSNDVGTFFQNRFRWRGETALLKFRSQADQWQEPAMGACEKGDVDSKGDLICKESFCCDMEVDYISISNKHPYGYGSAFSIEGSI